MNTSSPNNCTDNCNKNQRRFPFGIAFGFTHPCFRQTISLKLGTKTRGAWFLGSFNGTSIPHKNGHFGGLSMSKTWQGWPSPRSKTVEQKFDLRPPTPNRQSRALGRRPRYLIWRRPRSKTAFSSLICRAHCAHQGGSVTCDMGLQAGNQFDLFPKFEKHVQFNRKQFPFTTSLSFPQ